MAVDPQITTNHMWLMIRTACAGGGITFGMEDTFRTYVESGQLIPLLQDYCPPFAGFFITPAGAISLPSFGRSSTM